MTVGLFVYVTRGTYRTKEKQYFTVYFSGTSGARAVKLETRADLC
jgi:hypothetical protein